MIQDSRFKAGLVTLAVVAGVVCAYWYYSPYLAMRSLHEAAKSHDAESFNELVDYPKLRESLKGQMTSMFTANIGKSSDSSSQAQALGSAFALALINPLIDAMVRPEVVMKSMTRGEMPMRPPVSDPNAQNAGRSDARWVSERVNVDKIVAYAQESEATSKLGLVFERSGFAEWKLTEVRLPTQDR